ncbi:MAG: histidine kinase N-terminal 7TM domain-containing protein, partial [Patescibacteria group bacterium]|nr:histidine kinase N-terminal 7TM domain-containing protein [Patescibacteria group bacterium]
MQAVYSSIYILSSIAYVSLGLLVYAKNWRSRMNASFFWLCLSITGWVLTLYFFYFLPGDSLLLLGKLNFAFTELVIFFAFYFTYWFPKRNFRLNKLTNTALFLWLIVLSGITIFTDFIDKNEIAHNGIVTTEYGELYFLFIIHFFIFALAIAILPLSKYAKLSGLHRHQIKYFWIGAVLTLVPASTTNIILPLFFKRFDWQYLGPLFALFFIGLISYAIIAHRLMDIKIVLRRSFVFVISFMAVLLPAFLTRLLLAKIFGLSDLPINLLSDLVILVPALIIFPKIKKYFFQIANKY